MDKSRAPSSLFDQQGVELVPDEMGALDIVGLGPTHVELFGGGAYLYLCLKKKFAHIFIVHRSKVLLLARSKGVLTSLLLPNPQEAAFSFFLFCRLTKEVD